MHRAKVHHSAIQICLLTFIAFQWLEGSLLLLLFGPPRWGSPGPSRWWGMGSRYKGPGLRDLEGTWAGAWVESRCAHIMQAELDYCLQHESQPFFPHYIVLLLLLAVNSRWVHSPGEPHWPSLRWERRQQRRAAWPSFMTLARLPLPEPSGGGSRAHAPAPVSRISWRWQRLSGGSLVGTEGGRGNQMEGEGEKSGWKTVA